MSLTSFLILSFFTLLHNLNKNDRFSTNDFYRWKLGRTFRHVFTSDQTSKTHLEKTIAITWKIFFSTFQFRWMRMPGKSLFTHFHFLLKKILPWIHFFSFLSSPSKIVSNGFFSFLLIFRKYERVLWTHKAIF